MTYKYYKSIYWQNGNTELSLDSLLEQSFYYRLYYEPQLGIEVGERFINGKFDTVYYKGNNLTEMISYHNNEFRDRNSFYTLESLSEFTVIMKSYKNAHFSGASIINFDHNFEEMKICTFDEKFELSEFREFIKEGNKDINYQRLFIPSVWNLFKEEL